MSTKFNWDQNGLSTFLLFIRALKTCCWLSDATPINLFKHPENKERAVCQHAWSCWQFCVFSLLFPLFSFSENFLQIFSALDNFLDTTIGYSSSFIHPRFASFCSNLVIILYATLHNNTILLLYFLIIHNILKHNSLLLCPVREASKCKCSFNFFTCPEKNMFPYMTRVRE